MPTLYRWLQGEYHRLEKQGKHELADRFEMFRVDFFDHATHNALDALPDLYHLTTKYHEPGFQIVVDYYHAWVEIHWLGRLNKGLEIIMQAVAGSQRYWGKNSVMELYIRLALLFAWLDVDGPGYAPVVLRVIKEAPTVLPSDVRLRLRILEAYALMEIRKSDSAYAILNKVLMQLGHDWPEPYHHAIRADGLCSTGRLDEALDEYQIALVGFQKEGCLFDVVGMMITSGDVLLDMALPDDALRWFNDALQLAHQQINQAHVGSAQGGVGRTLSYIGEKDGAVTTLSNALQTLDGLGWLRLEAELALARYSAAPDSHEWQSDTVRRLNYLRSTDLHDIYRQQSNE